MAGLNDKVTDNGPPGKTTAFALIRNIQKLSGTALVADVFIVVGLIYIFSNEIALLAKRGVADVELFNSKDFPLLIGCVRPADVVLYLHCDSLKDAISTNAYLWRSGARRTAVFAFEGIGLILPVAESMREPQKFPRVLTGVMVGTMLLFAGGGALGYLTYGSKIQVRLLTDQRSPMVSVCRQLTPVGLFCPETARTDCRLCQPAAGRQVCQRVPVPVQHRDPPLDAAPTVPRRPDHGERDLCGAKEWQAEPEGQVGEERVQDRGRRRVRVDRVVWGGRLGQVC